MIAFIFSIFNKKNKFNFFKDDFFVSKIKLLYVSLLYFIFLSFL